LGVRRFFRRFFELRSLDELREEVFALAYIVKGFQHPIAEMDPDDREWFLTRARRQLEHEEKAMKTK
jgi:hypothetical protein